MHSGYDHCSQHLLCCTFSMQVLKPYCANPPCLELSCSPTNTWLGLHYLY